VKRFVSLQFLNSRTVGRISWTGDQPVERSLPNTRHHKHRIVADRHPCLELDWNHDLSV
jgi:hypothetical protein